MASAAQANTTLSPERSPLLADEAVRDAALAIRHHPSSREVSMAAYGLARRTLGHDAKRLEYGWLKQDWHTMKGRRYQKKLCHHIIRRFERETLRQETQV
jgi:ATP:corrinoid adenosyltransferase